MTAEDPVNRATRTSAWRRWPPFSHGDRGTGVIRNRTGTFDFVLTAVDGDQPGGGGLDKFRIRISDPGGVVYDNQMHDSDSTEPSTVIASGHIVIRN
jgi:hypothetical protein